jgi:Mg-chelatase subunit ChlD
MNQNQNQQPPRGPGGTPVKGGGGTGGDPSGDGTGGEPIGTDKILTPDQMQGAIEKDLKDAGVNETIAEQEAARTVRNHERNARDVRRDVENRLRGMGEDFRKFFDSERPILQGRLMQGRSSWFGSGMTTEETQIDFRSPAVRRNPVLETLLRHVSQHVTDVPPGASAGSVPTYSGINWEREVAQMDLPNRRVFPTERELYTRPVVVMVDTSGSQLNDEDLQKAVDTIHSILSKHRGQQVYVGHWADGMTPATIRKPIILEGGRSSKEDIKKALQNVQSGGTHLSSSLEHLRQAINKGRVVVNNQQLAAPEWGKLRDRRPSALLVITDGHIGSDDAEAVALDSDLMRSKFDENAKLPPMFVLYTHDGPNTLRAHLDAVPHFRGRHAYVGDRGDTE